MDTVAAAVGRAPSASAPAPAANVPAQPDATTKASKDKSRPAPPARRKASTDETTLQTFTQRYFDLRSEGYALERKSETPDPTSGASYVANSRRNQQATVALFIDICGDLPLIVITQKDTRGFSEILQKIASNHGKSAKDKRPIREVVENADAEEVRRRDEIGFRMRAEGRSPGEVEDAMSTARIPRLRTDTCVRHMRDFKL
uniref:hypothetical protein n=1 Tax=Pararhodobacter sp. SW119 TaxID=2780075 RepID=UPI001AE0B2EA